MWRRRVMGMLLVSVLATGFVATAQDNAGITVEGVKALFQVNGDDTISLTVSVDYESKGAAAFRLLVPVPAEPTALEQPDGMLLAILDGRTEVDIREVVLPCQLTPVDILGHGEYGIITEPAPITEYDVMSGTEALARLDETGFPLTAGMETVITGYIEHGYWFVDLSLEHPTDSSAAAYGQFDHTAPITITYAGNQPVLPLGALTLNASPEYAVPVIVWVQGDGRYTAENYASPVVEPVPLEGNTHQIASIGSVYYGPLIIDLHGSYNRARAAALRGAGGQAFVTEYAQAADPVDGDAREFGYTTRLVSLVTTDELGADPVFSPLAGGGDVERRVDFNQWVDPIDYWGCSTRSLLTGEMLANLPGGRLNIPFLNAEIAYPADWTVTELRQENARTGRRQDMWIAAPAAVDWERIRAYFDGTNTAPMFVLADIHGIIPPGLENAPRNPSLHDRLMGQLSVTVDPTRPRYMGQWFAALRLWPAREPVNVRRGENPRETYRGLLVAMLADPADWAQHESEYEAMIDYARAYQFFTREDMRHTLFLADGETVIQIPYPDGWVERTLATRPEFEVDIRPTDSADFASAPTVGARRISGRWEDTMAWIIDEHKLPASTTREALTADWVRYQTDRTGMVRLFGKGSNVYLIDLSAPQDSYPDYEPMLSAIAEGIVEASLRAIFG